MAAALGRIACRVRPAISSLHDANVLTVRCRPVIPSIARRNLSVSSCRLAAGPRLFSDKHEWVTVDGKVGTVGISQYAQEALGDIVYAQIPDVGESFSQHDEVGALESVKAASEVYTPVSGKILSKNKELEDSPGLINKSCYEKGWLFTIELKNLEELKTLMDEKQYDAFLKEQHSS